MVSILDSIKQMLGIRSEDEAFDKELIIHINGALMILNQLGVGPAEGYVITSKDDTWSNFIGTRKDLELIKTAIFLRVSLSFDPPQNSFLVSAMEKQIEEFDWRINLTHEETNKVGD